jgi:hypothetical protein
VDLAAAAVDLDREQDLNGIPGLSERNQET